MPAELIILAPTDGLNVLIQLLARHPAFDFHSWAVMLDCDGTLTDLDHLSGTVTLRGGMLSLRFFQWMHMTCIPYFVISARSTNSQTTFEVAQTVAQLQLPRPSDLEQHWQESFVLKKAEEIPWGEEKEVGLACGHVVSSVPHIGVNAALPKSRSIEFAVQHFLSDDAHLVLVDDVFTNLKDLYLRYMNDPDTYCICVYYPRPIVLPDSELEDMLELWTKTKDMQDKLAMERLRQEALMVKARAIGVAQATGVAQQH